MSIKWAGEPFQAFTLPSQFNTEKLGSVFSSHKPELPFIFCHIQRTKIFIRYARTLFATEDAFEICKNELGKQQGIQKRGFHFPPFYYKHLLMLLLQLQEYRPNTKVTEPKESFENRKKLVSNIIY